MSYQENKEIKEVIGRLKAGMLDFITPGETAYSEKDVEQCMGIISDYLIAIEKTKTMDDVMETIEKSVISLNKLNENCDFELIEEDQQEDLSEIIMLGGNLRGYVSRDEDLTEEFREW